MLGNSSSVLATTATTSSGGGGGGGGSNEAPSLAIGEVGHVLGEEKDIAGRGNEGDRNFGGNRWPRQETLALLKIRSEMDVGFRDASVKSPLWEEVSRKLAELGYNRSAKKCKEKFENVYKYHKRTKEGRSGKQEGKAYRFFDQLEALKNNSSSSSLSLPAPPKPQTPAVTTIAMPVAPPPPSFGVSHVTVPSAATTTPVTIMSQGIAPPTVVNLTIPSFPATNPTILHSPQATNSINNPSQSNIPSFFPSFSPDLMSNSTSSSTSSDVELQGRHKRKRKWKDFFEKLMREVIQKQEEMQRKFLEAIEKREHERMAREESWRMQEITRINREREILAQERSIAAAKDAAVMGFLQKLSEQKNPEQIQNNTPQTSQQPPPAPPPQQPVVTQAPPQLPVVPVLLSPQPTTNLETWRSDNGDQNFMPSTSSRWPKIEIQALIRLRTSLDSKYQENGPKGPLWEEISAGMRKIGYNRSAKRCKEKWENINKYFKKVKESNKKRPEDSKTCPYFHELDALYKERNKIDGSSNAQLKPENSVPLMVRPEQQWPPPQQEHRHDLAMEDLESEDHQSHQDEDDKDNDDEEEDEAGGYEIVANKPASMSTAE